MVGLSYITCSEVGPIERAIKQSNKMGVIKRVFWGTYSQRKAKAYNGKISNVLQSFQVCPQFTTHIVRLSLHLQAALAFNPHFVRFAERIEVSVPSASQITLH